MFANFRNRHRWLFQFLVLCGCLLLTSCSYHYDGEGNRKLLPCPLQELPYEIDGTVQDVWVGNEFQMEVGEHTHYIVLQGVNNPDSIRRHEDMSYDKLKSLLSDCIVHVNVNLRDERKRGVGRVYVGDMDVNLEMVLTGMGRYDGSVFTGWESFKSAEDSAKHQKLGIWADLDE